MSEEKQNSIGLKRLILIYRLERMCKREAKERKQSDELKYSRVTKRQGETGSYIKDKKLKLNYKNIRKGKAKSCKNPVAKNREDAKCKERRRGGMKEEKTTENQKGD